MNFPGAITATTADGVTLTASLDGDSRRAYAATGPDGQSDWLVAGERDGREVWLVFPSGAEPSAAGSATAALIAAWTADRTGKAS